MHDLFKGLFDWYGQSLDSGGYWLVALLMAIESSIVPLPSELIIPPAVIVAQRSGNMTLTGIVIAGAIGSWVGATGMYWASRWAGRPLVLKFSAALEHWTARIVRWPFLLNFVRHLLITPEKIGKAERWSAQFGSYGIFASRLLPVVRHLIGIPAGIVRMHYGRFSLYTLIGSGLWCTVLCWVGIKAGQNEALMRGEMKTVTLWFVGAIAVLGAIYYFLVHRFSRDQTP